MWTGRQTCNGKSFFFLLLELRLEVISLLKKSIKDKKVLTFRIFLKLLSLSISVWRLFFSQWREPFFSSIIYQTQIKASLLDKSIKKWSWVKHKNENNLAALSWVTLFLASVTSIITWLAFQNLLKRFCFCIFPETNTQISQSIPVQFSKIYRFIIGEISETE